MDEHGQYDVAQICESGHVINSSAASMPTLRSRHCTACGAKTLMDCPACNTPIRGVFDEPGLIDFVSTYRRPAFCHSCGAEYPWTVAHLEAAQELAEEVDDLSLEERRVLATSLPDLLRDSPRTDVAVVRVKRLAGKLTSTAGAALRKLIVDIASESARKALDL